MSSSIDTSVVIGRTQRLLARFRAGVQRHGALKALPLAAWRVYEIAEREARKRLRRATYERRLRTLRARIVAERDFIDLFHVPMGWYTPLFQRFQHMSVQAARLGGLALYGAHPIVDKHVLVFEEVQQNLIIFDATDPRVCQVLREAIRESTVPRVLRLQSIDLATTPAEVDGWLADGVHFVYEYIDEITEQITGAVPEFVHERHKKLLADPRVYVVATADKLARQVQQHRSQRFALSTNGVDPEVWQVRPAGPPADLRPVLASGRPVVAYHGAIARWLGADLLEAAANTGLYELLLIGYEHDDALRKRGLLDRPNVHFLGPRKYHELPAYAAYYDVAILPFSRGEITDSVSPVKIFEYMAAGKPIVTTDLPECTKYRSCLIADSPQAFLDQLQRALALRTDADYLQTLRDEAQANAWIEKARGVYRALGVLK